MAGPRLRLVRLLTPCTSEWAVTVGCSAHGRLEGATLKGSGGAGRAGYWSGIQAQRVDICIGRPVGGIRAIDDYSPFGGNNVPKHGWLLSGFKKGPKVICGNSIQRSYRRPGSGRRNGHLLASLRPCQLSPFIEISIASATLLAIQVAEALVCGTVFCR